MDTGISRIIDANINRLIEGVRVVEEVARFILEDKKLTSELKNMRARVGKLSSQMHESAQIMSRDSKKDLGRYLYPESEGKRTNIPQIIAANIKRAEEASRVLEEFGKLIDPKIGLEFKDIRFELYELEKKINFSTSALQRFSSKLDFDLYVVTDPNVLAGRSPVHAVKEAIKGGAKIVQLRDKKASIGQYYKWAKDIMREIRRSVDQGIGERNIKFIVNDYIDICLALDADGVHLGQDDVPVSVARKLLGPDKLIGLSTHSKEQALEGAQSGADYISIGPIFETPSKPGMKGLGVEFVKWAAKNIKIPFVAIGGINESNIKDVIKAWEGRGHLARTNVNPRVAVIRAAIGKNDIAGAVRKLRRSFK